TSHVVIGLLAARRNSLSDGADESAPVGRRPNDRVGVGGPGGEKGQPAVEVDVVHESQTSGRQRAPCGAELEQDVPGRVHAVVQEELDRPKLGQKAWQLASARAANVWPAFP